MDHQSWGTRILGDANAVLKTRQTTNVYDVIRLGGTVWVIDIGFAFDAHMVKPSLLDFPKQLMYTFTDIPV